MTFDVHQLDQALLVGAAVTLVAIMAARVSARVGLPSLLIYLLIGVAVGEAGLGLVFENPAAAHALGFAALAVILAEGGLTTSWREVRPSLGLGLSLATVGVAVSVAVVAVAAHLLLGLPWELAILLGAVVSPTDAAAVFSVLRAVPLPRRLVGALEAESGLNDAPTVVLVTLISTGAIGEYGLVLTAVIVILELLGGLAVGLGMGFAGAWIMRRVALPASGLYPLAVICLTFLAYGGAALIHASGFAAIYVAALILGNSDLPHGMTTRSFAEGLAWLAQIGLFVMLGLLLSPSRLTWQTVIAAALLALILALVARPASVIVSMLRRPLPAREVAFLSWGGLRGAVPVVLTTIPLAEHVVGSTHIFDLVFVFVILSTLVTAPSLPWVAKVLGITRGLEPRHLEVEAAPLDRLAADLLQVAITDESRLHGVEVGELRLPPGVSVSLLIRGDEIVVPQVRTQLRHGDELLVVTPRREREETEERLRLVSLHGRLGRWGSPGAKPVRRPASPTPRSARRPSPPA